MKDKALGIATVLSFVIALYFAFIYAPTEATMGNVQRIFYIHLPSAWVAMFLALAVSLVGSLGYLIRKDLWWDRVAASATEIAVVFMTMFLMTGIVWAKPIWGIWWTWDPRLTSALILWLIYVGYFMLRSFISSTEQRATLCAVFAILGYVDVPIVFMSIRWWRGQHPSPVFGGGGSIAPEMLTTVIVWLVAFTILFIYLLRARMEIARVTDEVEHAESLAQSA